MERQDRDPPVKSCYRGFSTGVRACKQEMVNGVKSVARDSGRTGELAAPAAYGVEDFGGATIFKKHSTNRRANPIASRTTSGVERA